MTRDPLQELLHSEVALMLVEEVDAGRVSRWPPAPRPELVLQQQLGTRPKNLSELRPACLSDLFHSPIQLPIAALRAAPNAFQACVREHMSIP